MNSAIKISIFYIALISIVVLLVSGCGSSVESPTAPSDEDSDQTKPDELVVDVKVNKKTVSPGDTVELTAEVPAVKSNQLIFRWVNVTGYGTLSNSDKASTVWTAPEDIASGEVKVEVIHLVVTAISKIISVEDSKVKTDTEIHTATKTIPLTVKG